MEERRVFPRIDCPKDNCCTVACKEEGRFNGQLTNISRKGASIISQNRIEDNSKLDVVINYPDINREIHSVIQIIWSSFKDGNYRYGGRLVDINNEDKYELLDHFYESWKRDIVSKR